MVVRAAGQLQRRESALEHQVEALSGTFSFKEHTAGGEVLALVLSTGRSPHTSSSSETLGSIKSLGVTVRTGNLLSTGSTKHNYDISHEMSIKGSS